MARYGVWLTVLLLMASAGLPLTAGDRASSALTLDGTVLTGDGSSTVRGATVTLEVYNSTGALVHLDLTVAGDAGNYSFSVPEDRWDPGWTARVKASYALVGVSAQRDHVLSAASTQNADVTLPWNRTLGAGVTVPDAGRTSGRDGIYVSWAINVTNGGNDTDAITLWATTSNPSIATLFNPGNSTVLAPGGSKPISLVASSPGLEPGDYGISLHWRSTWFQSERGAVDLRLTVLPEVELALPKAGVTWYPDPLKDGDDALLNCTVVNGGRDPALLANVTMELVHPLDGLVLRDKVRTDVPGLGLAVASFPWRAVYSEASYTLRFKVDHPQNGGPGPDQVEVPLAVGVENTPPEVNFLSPPNGTTVNGTVLLRLRVTDPDGPVLGVRLGIGGGPWTDLPVQETPTYSWDTTVLEDGWYGLVAYAYDAYEDGPAAHWMLKVGNEGPNTPPLVLVESPADGDTVGDVLRVRGHTLDTEENVRWVNLRIDGGEWMLAEGTSTWGANVSTDDLTEGLHTLDVQAGDGIDLSEVVSVQFRVTRREATSLGLSLGMDPPTVLPNERVDLRGELVYDNGVRAEGLSVRIEGPNGLLVYKQTDARGTFRLTTVAPGAEGTYDYTASATDPGDLSASNVTHLRVLKSLEPDLAVEAISIESAKVAVGINVTVGVDLRNLGYTTGNGTLRVWAGPVGTGEPIEDRPVTIYEQLTVSFVWVPKEAREVDLTAEVVDVEPSDANLSNNRLSEKVIVYDLPDLTLGNVTLSTPVPYANTTFTVSVRVDNLGGLNASCTVRLYLDGREPGDIVTDSDIGVPAHGYAYTGFDLKVGQGPHLLFLEIDNVYPEESRTDNDNMTHRFNAQGPFEPAPPDDGGSDLLGGLTPLAFISLLAVAALATVVAIIITRYG